MEEKEIDFVNLLSVAPLKAVHVFLFLSRYTGEWDLADISTISTHKD